MIDSSIVTAHERETEWGTESTSICFDTSDGWFRLDMHLAMSPMKTHTSE